MSVSGAVERDGWPVRRIEAVIADPRGARARKLNDRDCTLRARVERLVAAIVMGTGEPIGPQNDENIRFWLLLVPSSRKSN